MPDIVYPPGVVIPNTPQLQTITLPAGKYYIFNDLNAAKNALAKNQSGAGSTFSKDTIAYVMSHLEGGKIIQFSLYSINTNTPFYAISAEHFNKPNETPPAEQPTGDYEMLRLDNPTVGYRSLGDEESRETVEAGEYRVLDRKESVQTSQGTCTYVQIYYDKNGFAGPVWVLTDQPVEQPSSDGGRQITTTTITTSVCKNTMFYSNNPVIGRSITSWLTKKELADTGLYSPEEDSLYTAENIFNSYIINSITGSKIEFFMPNDISDAVSANFDSHDVRGATTQVQGYNSTSSRNLSFTVELLADYCPEDLYATIAKFKALAYPIYHGAVYPPWSLIKLGDIVPLGRYIINSVNVSYDGSSAIIENKYTHATVSIDAVWCPEVSYSALQVEDDYKSFSCNTRTSRSFTTTTEFVSMEDILAQIADPDSSSTATYRYNGSSTVQGQNGTITKLPAGTVYYRDLASAQAAVQNNTTGQGNKLASDVTDIKVHQIIDARIVDCTLKDQPNTHYYAILP